MDLMIQGSALKTVNGDLELVSGTDEIKQHVIVALNTFYNDSLINPSRGIDYAHGLRYEEFLEFDIKKQLSGVNGILSVDDFSMEFDKTNLTLNITASLKTVYGRLDIQNTINRG